MRWIFPFVFLCCACLSVSAQAEELESPQQIIAQRLTGAPQSVQIGNRMVDVHTDLHRFYAIRSYEAAWGTTAHQLPDAIEGTLFDGMRPSDYHLTDLEQFLSIADASPDQLADLDLLATDAFLKLADHLLRGRVNPSELYGDDWIPHIREHDLVNLLHDALTHGNIEAALNVVRPNHAAYYRLRQELARRQDLELIDLPTILPARTVLPGESDTRIPLVRERLYLTGDFDSPDVPDPQLLDEEVTEALRRYQQRNSLEITGALDNPTRHKLNAPMDNDVRALILNMERWRWLPDDFGDTYVYVNIPDATLQVWEEGEVALDMRVVVGRVNAKTPVLSDTLRSIQFAPTWGVPRSLAMSSVISNARRQGGEFLTNRGYTVIRGGETVDPTTIDWSTTQPGDYFFVQAPGPNNPMGRVKFNTTNPYDIYLHDTNERHLMQRENRALSAGCVRLSDARALAEWMLRHWTNWQPEDVARHMQSRTSEWVGPRDRWDIHLVYFTAWYNEEGLLIIGNDIYGHDEVLAAALDI